MASGLYWDLTNPLKPFGLLDPEEVKNIPLDFSEWLASEETTYVSHTKDSDENFNVVTLSNIGAVVIIRVNVIDPSLVVEGDKLFATILITAADGQKKSQTVFFKIKQL